MAETRQQRAAQRCEAQIARITTLLRGIMWGSLAALVTVTALLH